MDGLLAFRYWLHLVDLSVWINKQSTQLHKCMQMTLPASSSPSPSLSCSSALFSKDQVAQLLRLLLLSRLSFVPNPLNGRGGLRVQGRHTAGSALTDDSDGGSLSLSLCNSLSLSVILSLSLFPPSVLADDVYPNMCCVVL